MAWDACSRRRIFGCIVLTLATLLLVFGETWLKGKLQGVAFILYWMLCFICVGLAFGVALADLRALRRETREQARELMEETVKGIESDARKRPRRK